MTSGIFITSREYHRPEWDCTDDILETTEEIGKVAAQILLGEFVHGVDASDKDIHKILNDFVNRNVEAALQLAAKGLMERLQIGRDFDDDSGPPDPHIDIMEAVRIVRELDYIDEDE